MMALAMPDNVTLNALCNQILDDLTSTSKSVSSAVLVHPNPYQRKRLRNALVLLGGIQRRILEIRSHL